MAGHNGLGTWTPCNACGGYRAEAATPTGAGDYACDNPAIGPAPTGKAAADAAMGPMLIPDWDWTGTPTPTVLLEGGPEDWAVRVADECSDAFRAIGVFAEPYASYALSLYPED